MEPGITSFEAPRFLEVGELLPALPLAAPALEVAPEREPVAAEREVPLLRDEVLPDFDFEADLEEELLFFDAVLGI
ncbi:MAG: hypothetical protein K0Q66_1521 [Chitinophagaceae bacterium]|jgi:hypothetical protein|nr:hypothetical protein [Chitinophagaceae bacterium]